MYNLSKRTKAILIIAFVIMLLILCHLISNKIRNSTDYLHRKASNIIQRQIDEYTMHKDALHLLANQILDTSVQDLDDSQYQPLLKTISLETNPNTEIPIYQDNLTAYIKENNTIFDTVLVSNDLYYLYPAESCIFRTTQYYQMNYERSVYCWVNLVYNKNWQEILNSEEYQNYMKEGLIFEVAPNWCIVIEYGY